MSKGRRRCLTWSNRITRGIRAIRMRDRRARDVGMLVAHLRCFRPWIARIQACYRAITITSSRATQVSLGRASRVSKTLTQTKSCPPGSSQAITPYSPQGWAVAHQPCSIKIISNRLLRNQSTYQVQHLPSTSEAVWLIALSTGSSPRSGSVRTNNKPIRVSCLAWAAQPAEFCKAGPSSYRTNTRKLSKITRAQLVCLLVASMTTQTFCRRCSRRRIWSRVAILSPSGWTSRIAVRCYIRVRVWRWWTMCNSQTQEREGKLIIRISL